jgi:hypothetical protein
MLLSDPRGIVLGVVIEVVHRTDLRGRTRRCVFGALSMLVGEKPERQR